MDEDRTKPVIDSMHHILNQLEHSTEQDDAGQFVERLRYLRRLNQSLLAVVPETAHLLNDVLEASLSHGLALTPELYRLLHGLLNLQPITPAIREQLTQIIRQYTHKLE